MTLEGSSLHAEQRRQWDPWFASAPTRWSFEGTHPFSGAGNDGYSKPGSDPGGVYDAAVKILGNQSIRFHSTSTQACTDGGISPSSLYAPNSLNEEYWVRVYVRWKRVTNWPTNYTKMLYAMGAGYYFQPAGARPGANPTGMSATHDGRSHPISLTNGELATDRWFAAELHWKATPPRIFEVFWDGVRVYTAVPSGAGTGALRAFLFGIVNACGSAPWDIEHWMDGLALASTRIFPSAIVEVGNSPVYGTARKVIQPLETISDGQIQFRLDTKRLGSGPYLRLGEEQRAATQRRTASEH